MIQKRFCSVGATQAAEATTSGTLWGRREMLHSVVHLRQYICARVNSSWKGQCTPSRIRGMLKVDTCSVL